VSRASASGNAPTKRGTSGTAAFSAGELILMPGSVGDLYRLVSGLVRLHAVDGAGYGVTLRYVKPGGYFGVEALTAQRRRYFAEAVTDSSAEPVEVERLTRQGLVELSTFLASSLEHMSDSLLRLAGKPLRARVAAVLLELVDSALAGTNAAGDSVIYLTHDDLAAAVGSVRETVTKVIGDMARSGALRAGYGKIMVLDQRLLAEMANA